MIEMINKKIDDLSLELAKQEMTNEDMEEIETAVADYKQQLIDDKQEEYENNKTILQIKIDALKELKKEYEASQTATIVDDSL